MKIIKSSVLLKIFAPLGFLLLAEGITLNAYGMETPMEDNMSDLEGIKEAVFNYYYGVVDSDINRLEKAFEAPVGHLKFPPGKGDDDSEVIKVEEIEDSFKRWIAAEKDYTEGEIVNVDIIDGTLASVQFRFFIWDTNYLDLLTLYKINGRWKIVNKTFVVR